MVIKDRIAVITWARKVVGKHHHIEIVQAKIDIMLHTVENFKGSFMSLFQKGLPSFWEEDDMRISQSKFQALLVKSRLDHKKFEDMTQSLSQKIIIDKLEVDFELVNSFKEINAHLPPISYIDHVELRVLEKEMESLEFPSRDQWKTIEKFGKMKYKLHQ